MNRLIALLVVTFAAPAAADSLPPDVFEPYAKARAAQQKLQSERREPALAAVLGSILPGAGHLYVGDHTNALIVTGGWLATVGASYLMGYLAGNANQKQLGIWLSIAPIAAYHGFSGTEAFYQATLKNKAIEDKLKELALVQ